VVDYETLEEYEVIIKKIHKMLKGTKSMYKVSTRNE